MFYNKHVARWESSSGKHSVDLTQDEHGYFHYSSPGAMGTIPTELIDLSGRDALNEALAYIEHKVQTGYFQPDTAKTPMLRVK